MKYLVAESYRNMVQVGDSFEKNGKKYVEVRGACPRCGGSGIFYVGVHNGHGIPAAPDGGVCYTCSGSGFITKEVRVYTEKELAASQKAKERRQQKANEKLHKAQNEWSQKHGFNEGNTTFVFLTGNTYDIKDELKTAGYKFNNDIGWHGPVAFEAEGYKQAEVSFENLYEFAPYAYSPDFIGEDLVKQMRADAVSEGSASKYVGEIGERLRGLVVSYEGCRGFDGAFGYTYVYTFKYGDNIMNWFTTKDLDLIEGDMVILTGTVKKHEVYKDECVTYLNRCIVKEG